MFDTQIANAQIAFFLGVLTLAVVYAVFYKKEKPHTRSKK